MVKSASTHKTALLDADILAFEAAAVSQRTLRWPGLERPTVDADDWDEVPERLDALVRKWTEKAGAGNTIICLSCPSAEGWRKDILPSYKENRDESSRPVWLAQAKQYLEDTYPSYRRPRLEADDIMGILSTDPTIVPGKKVIVSKDKDMKTIPGWLFNPARDYKPRLVPEYEADYWHLYQTLVGDPTDNYKGCPKVGPKKAEAILMDGDDMRHFSVAAMWANVLAAFEARGLSEQDALIQARVARICRASDYDFKKKEVILWTPR